MAEYLCDIGSDVKWAPSGPDLSAQLGSETWYVECYTYRKSFGLMLFIEELLQQVDASIRVGYDLCMPFSLPRNQDCSHFLDSILSDFSNPSYIDRARFKALINYPVILLPKSENGLVIYMGGPDPGSYVPGIVPSLTGDSQTYLKVALSEAIRHKQSANSLGYRRPNLLAVNFSLSTDAQFAINQADYHVLPIPDTQLGPNIDALAVSVIGIDERLERSELRRITPAVTQNLALDRLTYTA